MTFERAICQIGLCGFSLELSLVLSSCESGELGRGGSPIADHKIADLTLEFSIGDEGSSQEYSFASIQSILVTHGNTLWVLDGESTRGQTPLIRMYDSAGSFIREVGQAGLGPGEYQAPQGLALMPDGRVALRDYRLPGRINFFDDKGGSLGVWSLGPHMSWPARGALQIQADTSCVLWLPFARPIRRGRGQPAILRVHPDGNILDTIPFPPVPEVDRELVRIPSAQRTVSVPYQPSGQWAWSPIGTFALLRTDRYEIDLLPPPGEEASELQARKKFTRTVPPIQIQQEERAYARRRIEERVSMIQNAGDVRIPDIPKKKPPVRYASFSEDLRLLVWVSMPSHSDGDEWVEPKAIDVFNPSGDFKGRVVLPPSIVEGQQLMRLRGNRLWCVVRTDNEIETVRRFRIEWH